MPLSNLPLRRLSAPLIIGPIWLLEFVRSLLPSPYCTPSPPLNPHLLGPFEDPCRRWCRTWSLTHPEEASVPDSICVQCFFLTMIGNTKGDASSFYMQRWWLIITALTVCIYIYHMHLVLRLSFSVGGPARPFLIYRRFSSIRKYKNVDLNCNANFLRYMLLCLLIVLDSYKTLMS